MPLFPDFDSSKYTWPIHQPAKAYVCENMRTARLGKNGPVPFDEKGTPMCELLELTPCNEHLCPIRVILVPVDVKKGAQYVEKGGEFKSEETSR